MNDWRRYVRDRLPPLDISAEREIEIVDELALQLEAAYETARLRGASDAEARAAAASEVTDWATLASTLTRIERRSQSEMPATSRASRDSHVIGVPRRRYMAGLAQDVRYAVRTLLRAPGFAAIAITTLALGIGATTIVFSLVDGILLKPLPIANPDRVVLAREVMPSGVEASVSWPNFVDWRDRAKSFEALAAWRGLPANLTGVDRPRRLMIRQVSWNLFDVLGVRPIVGRGLTQADDQPGVERVGLVSYGFWQRELGGSDAAIGRRIVLDETPVTVVGVLPANFTIARQEDVFVPFGNFLTPTSFHFYRGNHTGLAGIGRLKADATVESARAELATIAAQLAQEHPQTNSGQSATLSPLFEVLVSTSRPMLVVLFGAVLTMLLIACVNLANLLLARSSGRSVELAVRRALGAANWRIARHLLTESVLIGLCGGIGGALLAWAGFEAVIALLPSDQPRIHTVALDTRVLAVAAVLSIVTGLVFGLLPALRGATGRSFSLLRTVRVTGAASVRSRTRKLLVLVEVALALVLLAGAGVMVRTMSNLLAIDVGFNPDGLVSAQLSLPMPRYTAEPRRLFYDAVLERVRTIPGVVDAAMTNSLPVQGSNWNSVFIVDDQPAPAHADLASAAFTTVTPGYHKTMEIPLIRGRLFASTDGPASPKVVVVNESFVRRLWPDGDAIGRRVKQGFPEDKNDWREIVGIVRDVKTGGVDRPAGLQVYIPLAQDPSGSVAIVARTRGEVAAFGTALDTAVQQVDRNLPVYDIRTLYEVIGRDVGQQRLTTMLLLGFATLALLMAAIGVFGVTAYSVSQRTHELGVRMALGATRGAVVRLVLRQELAACAGGIVIGAASALALSSLLETLVYGVAPRDAGTLAVVSLVLIVTTTAAGYFPARRATRIDPVTALRIE